MGDESKFNEICAFIEAKMQEMKIPGISVGLLQDGEVYTRGLGITNVNHPHDVMPDTLFQIGSITKVFTTTAMMMLVDEGKITLDTTVRSILPDFKLADETTAERVTIWNLLTHSGGWEGDFFKGFGDGDDAQARYIAELDQLPQYFPSGTTVSYNNAGFVIAGVIIEAVSGQSYEEFITERIFKPLKMEMSFFFERDVMVHRFVVGHDITPDAVTVATPWPIPRASVAAGRIISTAGDILKFAQFHMNKGKTQDGQQLLSVESVEKMQTKQLAINADSHVCLGWFGYVAENISRLSHGGGTKGQSCLLILVPEHSLASIILTNTGRAPIANMQNFILEKCLGVAQSDPIAIETTPAELEAYVGVYEAHMTVVAISMEENQLLAKIEFKGGFPEPDSPPPPMQPPPVNLGFYAPDSVFVTSEGPMKNGKLEFIRDASGNAVGCRAGGRFHKRHANA